MSEIPYCYLFSRELNFAKVERSFFSGLDGNIWFEKIDIARTLLAPVPNLRVRI